MDVQTIGNVQTSCYFIFPGGGGGGSALILGQKKLAENLLLVLTEGTSIMVRSVEKASWQTAYTPPDSTTNSCPDKAVRARLTGLNPARVSKGKARHEVRQSKVNPWVIHLQRQVMAKTKMHLVLIDFACLVSNNRQNAWTGPNFLLNLAWSQGRFMNVQSFKNLCGAELIRGNAWYWYPLCKV